MYAELIFNYTVDENCSEIELPSPVEKSTVSGHLSRFYISELEVSFQFFYTLHWS